MRRKIGGLHARLGGEPLRSMSGGVYTPAISWSCVVLSCSDRGTPAWRVQCSGLHVGCASTVRAWCGCCGWSVPAVRAPATRMWAHGFVRRGWYARDAAGRCAGRVAGSAWVRRHGRALGAWRVGGAGSLPPRVTPRWGGSRVGHGRNTPKTRAGHAGQGGSLTREIACSVHAAPALFSSFLSNSEK